MRPSRHLERIGRRMRKQEKEKPLLQKIMRTPRLINEYRKLYNKLCEKCRAKVFRNPYIKIDAYCDKCKPVVSKKMEDIKKELSKK